MSTDHDAHNNQSSVSCLKLILPIIIVALVGIGIYRLISGEIENGVFLIIVGISLLIIYPTGLLARKVFSGKLGKFLKSDEIEHPIIQTKRFVFSVREEKRPWWAIYIFFLVIGLILLYVIMNYVN